MGLAEGSQQKVWPSDHSVVQGPKALFFSSYGMSSEKSEWIVSAH